MFIRKFKGDAKQKAAVQYLLGFKYATNKRQYNYIWKNVRRNSKGVMKKWTRVFYKNIFKKSAF